MVHSPCDLTVENKKRDSTVLNVDSLAIVQIFAHAAGRERSFRLDDQPTLNGWLLPNFVILYGDLSDGLAILKKF